MNELAPFTIDELRWARCNDDIAYIQMKATYEDWRERARKEDRRHKKSIESKIWVHKNKNWVKQYRKDYRVKKKLLQRKYMGFIGNRKLGYIQLSLSNDTVDLSIVQRFDGHVELTWGGDR